MNLLQFAANIVVKNATSCQCFPSGDLRKMTIGKIQNLPNWLLGSLPSLPQKSVLRDLRLAFVDTASRFHENGFPTRMNHTRIGFCTF